MSNPPLHDRVLSTLNQDGSRAWVDPRLSHGRFLRWRQIVGYALIALFVVLPFVRIGGRPALLLDLVSRELSIFGGVFRPSDGFVLMLFGLTIVLTVFLVTALFGRVWCGWGCPQTVYLEHVFRPIERWFEGSPTQRAKRRADRVVDARTLGKWAVYLVLAFLLANVMLAYFVGTNRLKHWVLESPSDHVGGFTTVMLVTALMMFDFTYFREQTCIVACPYGRLQTVLLDRQSLIVGYDGGRGEPRGKPRRALPVIQDAPALGACVDCGACVTTCPTGIDIRDGLQMECIGCAQCIDACDAVMDKLERPRGLIRYTSQDELGGKPRRTLRARTIIYPTLLAIAAGLLAWSVRTREGAAVWVLRTPAPAYVDLPDGRVAAQLRIKVENQHDTARDFAFALIDAPDASLRSPQPTWSIPPRRAIEAPLFVDAARTTFVRGERRVTVRVTAAGFSHDVVITLFGPEGTAP